ncbi:MAG: GNAT family N-acetyltransferase, partial [Thermosynechococcaceae cyanobacterium]
NQSHSLSRFKLYPEEMSRIQFYADHEKKRIFEPLDATASIFAAYENGAIVGTLRLNYSKRSDLSYYEEFYVMSQVGYFHQQRTSITTKLMLKPEYRKGTLAVRLANAAYALALKDRIRYDFIDANPHLIPFFEGLGYRIHKTDYHPEYGDVTVMVLDLEDINYLEKISSPFRREYQNFFSRYQFSIV